MWWWPRTKTPVRACPRDDAPATLTLKLYAAYPDPNDSDPDVDGLPNSMDDDDDGDTIPDADDPDWQPPTTPPNPAPAPQAITLTANAQDATTIQLSWSGAAGTLYASTEQTFSADATTRIPRGEAENNAAITSYTHQGLTPDTTYYYVLVPNGNPNLTQNSASATTPAPPVPTWSPSDKPIGWHPALDANEQPITPYQWSEDGRLTAPIDQRVENAPTEKVVQPGQTVTLAVEAAQDWDTRTLPDGTHSIASDTALTYTWSAQGQGHFLVTQEDGTQTQEQEATGTSAIWVAPDDVTEDTEVEVKCTIDDSTEELVVAPEAGSRDDEATVRSFTAKVVLPKVSFEEQSARACAGGVAVDGVHDFTIIGTAKDANGTLMPQGTEFKLSFENNRGHDYSGDNSAIWPKPNWTSNDIQKAKFITTNLQGNQVFVEEMTAKTDAVGQFTVHVLSSDIISSDIEIKVKGTNPAGQEFDAGEKTCDFAEAFGFRGFYSEFNPGADKGWKFNLRWLRPGVQTTAKIYLQFKIKANGGTVPSNLKRVNDHRMWFDIESVEPREGQASNTSDYATFLPATPGGLAIYPTRNDDLLDGAATAILKANPKIGEAQKVWLIAYDQSQWEN